MPNYIHRLQGRPTLTNATISLVTAHGVQELEWPSRMRLIDALIASQIPWSAVSLYTRHSGRRALDIFTGLELKAEDLAPGTEVVAFYQRNVDPFLFRVADLHISLPADSESASTEFIYREPKAKEALINSRKQARSLHT
jgi:hypothetical protein